VRLIRARLHDGRGEEYDSLGAASTRDIFDFSHCAIDPKLRQRDDDRSGSNGVLSDQVSDAITGRAIRVLPASGKPKQRNCASACAATVRIVGHGTHARHVIYSSDFSSRFDRVPFASAPTAQFSRGSLFPSDLIPPKKA
jgi:hypothetical protein